MVENYKLEGLYNALAKVRQLEGINVKNVQTFTKVLSDLEGVLISYFDKRREITKGYVTVNAEGKQEISDQVKLQDEIEELAKTMTEFTTEKINLLYTKGDKWFNVELNKAFVDVYGENYNLVDVE